MTWLRPGGPLKAEDIPKDIAERVKNVGEIPDPGEAGGRHTFVAVAVIEAPLFRVPKDLIGLRGLLEPLLRLLVPGIAVRVVLHGHLAVFFLDFFGRGIPGHFQDAVVVVIVMGHNYLGETGLYPGDLIAQRNLLIPAIVDGDMGDRKSTRLNSSHGY